MRPKLVYQLCMPEYIDALIENESVNVLTPEQARQQTGKVLYCETANQNGTAQRSYVQLKTD